MISHEQAAGRVVTARQAATGSALGLASGHTIWRGDNAAGWSGSFDATPGDDGEFTLPGNQDERHRVDLLPVLEYERGHLLGLKHTGSGVMAETLVASTRRMPSGGSDLVDVLVLDRVFADGQKSLATPFSGGPILRALVELRMHREGRGRRSRLVSETDRQQWQRRLPH